MRWYVPSWVKLVRTSLARLLCITHTRDDSMARRFLHFGGGPDPRHDSFIIGQSPTGNDLYIVFDTPPTRFDSRVITNVCILA